LTLHLIDTGIFLCLAFEDPGHQHCGRLLDRVFKGEITPLLSSIQLTELYTPFLRSRDLKGLQKMKREIMNLRPRIRDVDREVAEKAAEHRSSTRTPNGEWLALVDSILLATSILEGVESLYTIDRDFANVKEIKVEAPEMELKDWIREYEPKK